jgi:AraC-like DNA-binding protein
MADPVKIMSYSVKGHVNRGAYEQPFSGVGIEFDPLGVKPGRTGITLHESGFLPANDDWNFPAVFSPFWRLYYNRKRGHCVLFEEHMIELTPEHIMLIPPHQFFNCLGGNPVQSFWLAFSFTRRPHPEQSVPILLPPRDTELCLIRDLEALITADESWNPTDAIYRNSLALLQVVLSRPELQWQPPVPEPMLRVRDYLERQIRAKLLAPDLARRARLSVSTFNRSFKRHFGTTPARYLIEMRVREAARLLLQTENTLDAIAEETGFPNRAYLSRMFKRLTGEAPAGFRRKHRRSE